MEMAWHMTVPARKGLSSKSAAVPVPVFQGLMDPGTEDHHGGSYGIPDWLPGPDRIYAGDEFCRSRLPGLNALDRLLNFADEKGLPLTFLTPVLTDAGIEACVGLFDRLGRWSPSAEVVVNDLGVLFFLQKTYPDFQLSLGRLFNKGFKDPRLASANQALPEQTRAALGTCSFDHENIRHLAHTLGVNRFERDILPYAGMETLKIPGMETSVYFPFGYVTTGRACFMSGLARDPGKPFQLNNNCMSPCVGQGLKLTHPEKEVTLFQSGNTVFYRYSQNRVDSLINHARHHPLRLVYQGGLP